MNRFTDDDIRWLLDLLSSENLAEITIECKDSSVTVRADTTQTVQPQTVAPVGGDTACCAEENQTQDFPDHLMPLLAPVSGTFYRSASPDADAYVDVGDIVKAGDTVGLIEAMKLYHDINSPVSGRIAEFLVENEEQVEDQQPLMLIDRSEG
ncbi:MAG: acetyl-CoA carboxylase [Armatimonadota bacterium]